MSKENEEQQTEHEEKKLTPTQMKLLADSNAITSQEKLHMPKYSSDHAIFSQNKTDDDLAVSAMLGASENNIDTENH